MTKMHRRLRDAGHKVNSNALASFNMTQIFLSFSWKVPQI